MLTNRIAVLACLICGLTAAACGGSTGLDDFSNGADDIIMVQANDGPGGGNAGGASNGAGNSAGGATDADGGSDSDGGQPVNAGPKPGEKGGIGSACRGDRACMTEGAECVQEAQIAGAFTIEFPDGYCAIGDCSDDSDCPEGTGCLSAFGMQSCMQRCADEKECRTDSGYQCNTVGGASGTDTYCIPTFGGGGGQSNTGGQGGGGNDVSMFCSFVCQDAISIALCMAQNDLSVCMQGGGGFGG